MATRIVDRFQYTDGQTLDAQADWATAQISGSGVPTSDQHDDHTDNQVIDQSSTGSSIAVHQTALSDADQTVEKVCFHDEAATWSATHGVLARLQSATPTASTLEGYEFRCWHVGANLDGDIRLWDGDGTPQVLTTFADALPAGDVFKYGQNRMTMTVVGSTITGYFNGEQVVQITDSTYSTGSYVGFTQDRKTGSVVDQVFTTWFGAWDSTDTTLVYTDILQSVSNGSNDNIFSSLSCNFDTTPTAGNLLLAFVHWNDAGAPDDTDWAIQSFVDDQATSAWTLIGSANTSTVEFLGNAAYYKIADGDESSVTVTFGSAGTGVVSVVELPQGYSIDDSVFSADQDVTTATLSSNSKILFGGGNGDQSTAPKGWNPSLSNWSDTVSDKARWLYTRQAAFDSVLPSTPTMIAVDIGSATTAQTIDAAWSSGDISTFAVVVQKEAEASAAKLTGGFVSVPGDGYVYHTFTESGTLTPKADSIDVEYLTVAGGGGGGSGNNLGQGGHGGGGAGGMKAGTGLTISSSQTITIGAGGAGSVGGGSEVQAAVGSASSIGALVTTTGGGGGAGASYAAGTGGSGGGGGDLNNQTAGTGTSGEGSDGGTGTESGVAAGGGGAGQAGFSPVDSNTPGDGGDGLQWPSGSGTYYAGGGGGTGRLNSIGSTGGLGGGGDGPGASGFANGNDGDPNTGGGGSGGQYNGTGGDGGSGIVIIRYPISDPYTFAVQTDSPVAYWKLDDTNSTAVDSSVNSYDGTITGATTGVAGIVGDALSLAGGSDNVQVGATLYDALLASAGTSLSLEAWIKTSSTAEQQIVTLDNDGVSNDRSFQLRVLATTGVIRFTKIPNTLTAIDSTTAVNDGAWHHVVGTYDGTNLRVYIDGELEGTSTATSGSIIGPDAQPSEKLLYIGNSGRSFPSSGFVGTLDEVAVYDSVLTEAQIIDHYTTAYGASAVGGSISVPGDGYVYHTFTTSGTFTPNGSVSDDFDRADSGTLGSNWTEVSGSYAIASGAAAPDTSAGRHIAVWSTPFASADMAARARIYFDATEASSGVILSASNSVETHYLFELNVDDTAKIIRCVTGTNTTLDSASYVIGPYSTHEIEGRVNGGLLEFWVNGSLLVSYDDSASALTGLYAGIRSFDTGPQDPFFNNWSAGPVSSGITAEYLTVAGGGGGSTYAGGGAGGMLTGTGLTISAAQTIAVGGGGSGNDSDGTGGSVPGTGQTSGSASSIGALVSANGGGKGETYNQGDAGSGGSGGGAAGNTGLRSGGAGTAGQGNDGGDRTDVADARSGGGGGAGSVGQDGISSAQSGGDGGSGAEWPSGSGEFYASGGGGSTTSTRTPGVASAGGGGDGGSSSTSWVGVAGTANTGGGGGGGGYDGGNQQSSGSGGSGIVIIRYLITETGFVWDLTVTPVSVSQIDLAWNIYTGATGYDLERDTVIIKTDHVGTSYSDTGLSASTEYDYRVRGVLDFNPQTSITWHSLFWAEGSTFRDQGYADTDSVTTWPNETGEADLSTLSGTTSPTYVVSGTGLNSQPAVDFTNGGRKATSWSTGGPSTPFSLVVVGLTDVPGSATPQAFIDSSGALEDSAKIFNHETQTWRIYAGTAAQVGSTSDAVAHLFVASFDGSTGNDSLTIDGTVDVSGGNAGAGDISLGLVVGNNYNDTQPLDGRIAFVGVYEGDITADANWSDFTAWVSSHYGITIA